MKDFARALQQAWRLWPALTLAIACSLGVAALWGANIAALFPIIETTLHGQSLQEWNQKRVETAKASLATHEAEVQQLAGRLAAEKNEKAQHELAFQIEMVQAKMKMDRAGIYSAGKLQPFLERFMPNKPFQTVTLIILIVAVATAIKQLLMMTNTMLVAYVSQTIARDIRGKLFDKALSLDRPSFNALGISGFTANIAHTTDMLAIGITNFYGGAVTEPLRIIACLGGAWFISWRLTLASLIFAPIAAFFVLYLNRRIRALSISILDRSMGFHHVMLEVFNALLTVQAYTIEDFERRRFRDSTACMRRIAMKSQFYHSLSNPITELLGMGILCTGVIVSGYLVINQQTHIFGIPMCDKPMSVTDMTVFFALLVGASDPLRKLSTVITGVNSGMAAAGLIYPILERQPFLVESTNPKPLPASHQKIEFRNVSFSYDGIQEVIGGVNLTIPRGEHLAIVGPNGGGKSTIINLLCRFYDPRQGEVLIDGVSLRDVSTVELRKRIALVTQQTEHFNESIYHNIRYGRWDATEAEVIAAAKLARADGFITSFPEGYLTVVGPNGQRLSGGQRQRIALARAFLRNAEILIMDEATSQIDVESEKLIHDALEEYGHGRTLIMITHRESTLSLADRVVRVEHGKLEPLETKKAA